MSSLPLFPIGLDELMMNPIMDSFDLKTMRDC